MSLSTLLSQLNSTLFVKQEKEWVEIAIDFETSNRYRILDPQEQELAWVLERSQGVAAHLWRWLLRSHRPLAIDVVDRKGSHLMHFARSFFFFFSDLFVDTPDGRRLGSIHRRFSLIYKSYDLHDTQNRKFAQIRSPFWRLWTFPIFDATGQERGRIAKKWGGALREVFTDADTYRIELGTHPWTEEQRAVLLAAAISIDFDFFEENQGSSGFLDLTS